MALIDTIIGVALGFGAAILVEPIKNYFYGLRLEASFGDSPEFQTETSEHRITRSPEDPNKEQISYHKASYIRIKVTNTKAALAKGCRAYLVKVEKQHDDGNFCDTIYCDSIPLAWSCRGEQRFLPVDVPEGVNQFVDLLSTREVSTDYKPEIQFRIYRYTDLFKEHGTFRFTVQISGENVDPIFIKVVFVWDGSWDKYSCKYAP
ncbi:hypothetical protein ES703_36001 [subsurface metagenome]